MFDDYTKQPKFLPNSEGPLWVKSGHSIRLDQANRLDNPSICTTLCSYNYIAKSAKRRKRKVTGPRPSARRTLFDLLRPALIIVERLFDQKSKGEIKMAPPAAAAGGAALAIKVAIGGVVLVVVIGIFVQFLPCNGGACASSRCSTATPCVVQTASGMPFECTSGTACTAASLGTICETRWYWLTDCTCKTIRQGTNCTATCIK